MTELYSLGQYRIEADLDALWAAPGLRLNRCRAVDTVRKRPALLNLLEIDPGLDKRLTPRLLEQAQAAVDLVHPHLAWVWETGQIEGREYVAERLAQGQTLSQRLAERGPLGWGEAQKTVTQIAQGLDFAHARGWIHGALTPDHIWLSPDLGALVSGWGMQRGLRAVHLDAPALVGRAAADHPALLALLPYLAPEALLGGQSGPASDQYALACLWYEMLTAQKAFPAASPEELLVQQSDGLHFPGLWPEGTPWELETTLERATAEAPAGRYASAGELAAAPQKLADEPGFSAEERARRAEQARQRREAADQVRRQAEEGARLAALAQARREIDDRVRRAAQANLDAQAEEPAMPADETAPLAAGPDASPAAEAETEGPTGEAPAPEPPPPEPPADERKPLSQPVVMAVGAAGPGIARHTSAHPAARGLGTAHKPVSLPGTIPAIPAAAAQPENADAAVPVSTAEPDAGRAGQPPVWLVWAGLILAAALVAGLWWSGRPGAAGPTATAAAPSPSASLAFTFTPRPSEPPSATPVSTQAAPLGGAGGGAAPLTAAVTRTAASPAATSAIHSVTATLALTATRTLTPTATFTATPTATLTATPTATPRLSQTRLPRPTGTPYSLPTKDPEDTRRNSGPTRRP